MVQEVIGKRIRNTIIVWIIIGLILVVPSSLIDGFEWWYIWIYFIITLVTFPFWGCYIGGRDNCGPY